MVNKNLIDSIKNLNAEVSHNSSHFNLYTEYVLSPSIL
jgi:hypothetical protein